MTIRQAREALKKAYERDGKPAIVWVKKVDGMADNQVVAILQRLRDQGAVV